MIRRIGKGAAPNKRPRPLASPAGAREGVRERIRGWFSLLTTPVVVDQMDRRRRILSVVLIAYLVILLLGALLYNFAILREQADLRTQVEMGSIKVASMQRLMGQVEAEGQNGSDLELRLEQLYRELPGAVELPIVIQRLAQLSTWSGGLVSGIEYTEPRWSGGVGHLQTHASLNGSLREVAAYVKAMSAMLPASTLERLSIRLGSEPGQVSADLLISAAAIRERPAGTPRWDMEAAWRRAEAAARQTTVSGFPFTPGAQLWQVGRDAGIDLPELRLAGIARRGGEAFALIVYGDENLLVRSGGRVGAVEVISIDSDGILVQVGGRTLRFELGGTRQGDSRAGHL